MDRRDAMRAAAYGFGVAVVAENAFGQSQPQAGGKRVLNVVNAGADPSGGKDSAAAFQDAIGKLAESGGILYIPAGRYTIGKTLEWTNPKNARMPGILFQGDSPYSSILRFTGSGPLLRVRGVPRQGPVSTTFFWGGGIQDLTLEGSGGSAQDGVEIMGWWYGEISNCRFTGFSGNGIRAITDLALDHNPDLSASTMFVRGTWVERCGGWGFIDDGGPQGAPAWSWDRCVFVFCKKGGAFVQSSSHGFVKCSFSGCGWQNEKSAGDSGYGLYFSGALTTSSRQWVEGCEFDTNLTAHIAARFLSCSSFLNNRFIFHDRYKAGHLCPPTGVEIGAGDAHAAVKNVEFRQSFFRFDSGGSAVGFDWVNTANVRDISVSGSLFSDNNTGVKVVRYRGQEAHVQDFGYAVSDRESR